MRLSLIVNILLVLAIATAVIGAGLFMNLLAVPGGSASATTLPPNTGPLPTLNFTPTPGPTDTPSPEPSVRPTAGGTHIVQPGETLSSIGALYGVPWLQIAEANNIPSPYIIHVGDELIIPIPVAPCGDYQAYTVQPGDFLVSIGQQFNVSWSDIADFNNLASDEIHPGDVLCIPQPGWTPLPTPSG